MSHAPEAATTDPRSLAASLVPVLVEACDGRLQNIRWFKTDWQRGGAATAYADYVLDNEAPQEVVIKLPVVPRELRWTRRLQHDETGVVPRLLASGEELGGYDLAWVIIERLPHGPLGLHWHDGHIERIADAVARFASCARSHPVDQPPRIEEWDRMIEGAIENARLNEIPDQRAWADAFKQLKSMLGALVTEWRDRPCQEWQHGDVHLANAMSRTSETEGPVCLIDLAEVHAGHWVEDAVYLERQLWARPERLKATKPVRAIAQARRKTGLPVGENYARLAMIRRGLLAATAPYFIRSEGSPAHLQACLKWLEIAMNELG